MYKSLDSTQKFEFSTKREGTRNYHYEKRRKLWFYINNATEKETYFQSNECLLHKHDPCLTKYQFYYLPRILCSFFATLFQFLLTSDSNEIESTVPDPSEDLPTSGSSHRHRTSYAKGFLHRRQQRSPVCLRMEHQLEFSGRSARNIVATGDRWVIGTSVGRRQVDSSPTDSRAVRERFVASARPEQMERTRGPFP